MHSLAARTSPESIEFVLDSLEPRLQALLWRYQIPEGDREDVIQEAVLVTLTRWDHIENKERWLFVAARNLCVVHYRKRKCWERLVETVDPELLTALAVAMPPPQAATETAHDIKCVKRVGRELAQNERELLYWKYCRDLGPRAIAAKIGCHPGNVRKVTLRVIARLRTALGRSAR